MIKVHPSAVVHKSVQLGEDVIIGPNCVVEEEVSIGSGTGNRGNNTVCIHLPDAMITKICNIKIT